MLHRKATEMNLDQYAKLTRAYQLSSPPCTMCMCENEAQINEMRDSKSLLIQPSGGIAAGFPNVGAYTITTTIIC